MQVKPIPALTTSTKINILGFGVMALTAGVSWISWQEYKLKQNQQQQQQVLVEFEQKLAGLELAQRQQFEQLLKQGKALQLTNAELKKIKLQQDQHRKQLANLKQNYYSKVNHDKMLKKFKKVPDVQLYKVKPIVLSDKEKWCLSKNIYHEAAYEPVYGRLAVAQVTGNRVKNKHGGSTYCSVVYSKAAFSWTLEQQKRNYTPQGKEWLESKAVTELYLQGYRIKGLDKADHYYARYIKEPYWAKDMQYKHYVGLHLFLAS